MNIRVSVILWGTTIGTAFFDENNQRVIFQYDEKFVRSGVEVSPIMMPLSNTAYYFTNLNNKSFKGLPGLLADSLPDRFGTLINDSWFKENGIDPENMNVVERLCYVGVRGMGALEFKPSKSIGLSTEDDLRIDELIKTANHVLSKRKEISIKPIEGLDKLVNVGGSAGGARAKALVAYCDKSDEFRSGQIDAGDGFTYWLIKFDGIKNNVDKDADEVTYFTRIEFAYYLMAVSSGITMSESRLYEESGRYHFMTKRFDREIVNGKMSKIHMQSLGALEHLDYEEAGMYSYEKVISTFDKMKIYQTDVEEFFRRMVFNVLSINCDDHVKNISFLMNKKGEWSLSPAYDMTYAYNPSGLWTSSHQMTINGKRKNITIDDLMAVASTMAIGTAKARTIINQVHDAVLSFPKFAKEALLPEKEASIVNSSINDNLAAMGFDLIKL